MDRETWLILVVLASTALALAGEWLETRRDARRSDKKMGKTGQVRRAIVPGKSGLVFVDGELWRATADVEIPKGAAVRVKKVDGLTVYVEPVSVSAPVTHSETAKACDFQEGYCQSEVKETKRCH